MRSPARSLDRAAARRITSRLLDLPPEARREWLDRMRLAVGLDVISGGYDPHANFGYSTVQAGSTIIGSTGTPKTVVLETGDGAAFPAGAAFNIVVWPSGVRPSLDNAEIVRVTRSGDTLTTTGRGQEGTTALSTIVAGYQVMAAVTAKALTDIEGSLLAFGTREYTEVGPSNTVAETSLYAAQPVIPGGALGTDGTLDVFFTGRCRQGTTMTLSWTYRVYLGGTLVLTAEDTGGNATAGEGSFLLNVRVEATGSQGAQYVWLKMTTNATYVPQPWARGTSTIDMTANRVLNVTLQLGTAGGNDYLKKQFSSQAIALNA